MGMLLDFEARRERTVDAAGERIGEVRSHRPRRCQHLTRRRGLLNLNPGHVAYSVGSLSKAYSRARSRREAQHCASSTTEKPNRNGKMFASAATLRKLCRHPSR